MKCKVNWQGSNWVFVVPDFIEDHLILASGSAIKVLLYILKHKIVDIDTAEIAGKFNISVEDVEDAISYWVNTNVLISCDNSRLVGPVATPVPKTQKTQVIPSPANIEAIKDSSNDLKFLFDSADSIWGKPLSYSDRKSLVCLFEQYGIAPDLLIMIISFAKQINKANMKYVEKIAINWSENNISSHELASREISRMGKYYSFENQLAIKLNLNRRFTSSELDFLKDWSSRNVSVDLVILAYEKTIDSIGKVQFSYMNKIILNWCSNGITTVEAAKASGSRKQNAETPTSSSREHSYDLNLLMNHIINNPPKPK